LQLDNRAGLWHSMISVAPMTIVAKELVRRRTVVSCMIGDFVEYCLMRRR
jgi:hypothetical protein